MRAKGSRLVPEARREFKKAVRYYRSKDPELGVQFAEAVRAAIRFGMEDPETPPLEYDYRKLIVRGPFPYTMYFRAEDGVLVVAAVWAQARDPDVLKARLAKHP